MIILKEEIISYHNILLLHLIKIDIKFHYEEWHTLDQEYVNENIIMITKKRYMNKRKKYIWYQKKIDVKEGNDNIELTLNREKTAFENQCAEKIVNNKRYRTEKIQQESGNNKSRKKKKHIKNDDKMNQLLIAFY